MPEDTNFKLLILNGDLPVFPGRAGHEYLHTVNLARLCRKVGLVSLVHTVEQLEKAQALHNAGVELYLWKNPHLDSFTPRSGSAPRSRLRRLLRRVYYALRGHPWRPRDTFLQDLQFRNMAGPILEALGRERWDAVVVVQSQCAHWLDYLPRSLVNVLVLHDVRAIVYERRARVAESWLERLAYGLEALRYRYFERKWCHRYDLVVTVSPTEEKWVREHYRLTKVTTVLIPVDHKYFQASTGSSPQDTEPPVVLFTGLMDHPPNVDAARFFAHAVFPLVRERVPGVEFWIVGRDPSPAVSSLAALPGVRVTGFVPDIRPYIARATVVVVPLRFGSGMRNKILEAWAMEKCVISTTVGAEGLDYEDGLNILIADDVQTMADKVIRALRDPNLRDGIGKGSRELVVRKHDPASLAEHYHTVVSKVVAEKRRVDRPMRVVIDLRWMRPGVAGGIENVARSFLRYLTGLDRSNSYTILLPAEVRYDFDLRTSPNFRAVAADGPLRYWRHIWHRCAAFLHRRLGIDYWRSAEVEALRFLRSLDADVALSLSGYIISDLYGLRNVVVVHDLQYEYHPEFFSPQEVAERKRVFGEAIRRADYLIAVSEYTRKTVLERYHVDPSRVKTVYEAADPIFHPENRKRLGKEEVLRKYGLPNGEYLFFPANTWPHKNHLGLLKALAILRDTYGLAPLLVCTGTPKEAQPLILKTAEELRLRRQLRFLGYCPLEDMPPLYEGAAALVYPSFFEGFGIPLVEAMWCDCPIVCSNVTSLPEVAGEAALLVDPRQPEQIADAVARILVDTELRSVLIERGRRQVRRFTWRNFTLEVVKALYAVHSGCVQ